MKIEGKDVRDHPVLYKLTSIKTLLDQLNPLDERLNLSKIQASIPKNEDSEVESSEDYEKVQSSLNEQQSEAGEEELSEMSEDTEMPLVTEKEEKRMKKKLLKRQMEALDDEEGAIDRVVSKKVASKVEEEPTVQKPKEKK